jgi:hypothetical protein
VLRDRPMRDDMVMSGSQRERHRRTPVSALELFY